MMALNFLETRFPLAQLMETGILPLENALVFFYQQILVSKIYLLLILANTCPKLPPLENGWFLPSVCNSDRVQPGQSCYVYCRKGFKVKQTTSNYFCNENLQWNILNENNVESLCVKGKRKFENFNLE